jgi:hypothetical protein
MTTIFVKLGSFLFALEAVLAVVVVAASAFLAVAGAVSVLLPTSSTLVSLLLLLLPILDEDKEFLDIAEMVTTLVSGAAAQWLVVACATEDGDPGNMMVHIPITNSKVEVRRLV